MDSSQSFSPPPNPPSLWCLSQESQPPYSARLLIGQGVGQEEKHLVYGVQLRPAVAYGFGPDSPVDFHYQRQKSLSKVDFMIEVRVLSFIPRLSVRYSLGEHRLDNSHRQAFDGGSRTEIPSRYNFSPKEDKGSKHERQMAARSGRAGCRGGDFKEILLRL